MARILVIDDTAEFCRMMSRVLERAGHECISAQNGVDGLLMAEAEQPDLILLDQMMPDMNGREVFANLRAKEETRRIPVIMVTAFSTNYEADRMDAMQLGINNFLTKPISPSGLVEAVNDVLKWSPQARG